MKSTSGKYYIGLDHLRAIAAFMVFVWHFSYASDTLSAAPPIFPLSLLTEGHTGVSLFMVLSGYLFAKLLTDKSIIFSSFIWNRFLRLAPLLAFMLIIYAIDKGYQGEAIIDYLKLLAKGLIYPTLPDVAWSITVEFHFYLILPLLLVIFKKWRFSLFAVLICMLLLRVMLHEQIGQIQQLSYFTIVGRADQFLFGIIGFHFRDKITGRHFVFFCGLIMFLVFYQWFDGLGGFYQNPSYPSPSSIWIYLPTLEGFFYALIVVWYDNSVNHSTGKASTFLALIGNYSYSIYLFHFFFVFKFASFVDAYITQSLNIYVTLLLAPLFFLLMVPIGYLSFRFIEAPFLKYRTNYFVVNDKL